MSKSDKTVVYLTAAQLDKEIPLIAAAGKKLEQRIQVAALSALNHLKDSGDPVYINRLYLAMAAGLRRSALTEWLLQFGRVSANEDAGTKKEKPFLFDREKKLDIEGATAKPWYDCRKEPEPDEVFDAGKAFSMLLTKLDNAIKAGKPIKGMSAGQLDRMRHVMGGDVAEDLQSSAL